MVHWSPESLHYEWNEAEGWRVMILVCKYCMARRRGNKSRGSIAPVSHGFSWGSLIRRKMEEMQESYSIVKHTLQFSDEVPYLAYLVKYFVAVPIGKVELKLEAGKLCKSSEGEKKCCLSALNFLFSLIVGYFLFL